MTGSPYVAIGRVVKTHGLHGEVSVATAAGASLDSLLGVQVWFIPPGAHVRSTTIADVRRGPKGPLVTFEDIGDIDTASLTVGCEILVMKTDLPVSFSAVVEGQSEVEGFMVIDAVRGDIGRIVSTIHTGANDVWEVEGPFGDVLIPVIDDVVRSVDRGSHVVSVTLLDGLIGDEG